MAGGMLTKQADFLTNRKLNIVNDAASGGVIVSLPAGVTGPAVSQTIPGDRIVLDDATASALSNSSSVTTVLAAGLLYGGVYMYVGTLATSTAAPAIGALAFWAAAQLPNGTTPAYTVTADAQPTAAVPAYIAGVFLNAITKGNFGWIQVAGFAMCQFDSTTTSSAAGVTALAKASPTIASSVDSVGSGTTMTGANLAFVLGVTVGSPISSTISSVIITRGNFCGRI